MPITMYEFNLLIFVQFLTFFKRTELDKNIKATYIRLIKKCDSLYTNMIFFKNQQEVLINISDLEWSVFTDIQKRAKDTA